MIYAIVALALVFLIAIFFFVRQRRAKRLAAANAAREALHLAAKQRAQADEAAMALARAAEAARVSESIAAAIREQADFEVGFNATNKVRYDAHLRRRAVQFRLQQKLGRTLTVGEIVVVKESVS